MNERVSLLSRLVKLQLLVRDQHCISIIASVCFRCRIQLYHFLNKHLTISTSDRKFAFYKPRDVYYYYKVFFLEVVNPEVHFLENGFNIISNVTQVKVMKKTPRCGKLWSWFGWLALWLPWFRFLHGRLLEAATWETDLCQWREYKTVNDERLICQSVVYVYELEKIWCWCRKLRTARKLYVCISIVTLKIHYKICHKIKNIPLDSICANLPNYTNSVWQRKIWIQISRAKEKILITSVTTEVLMQNSHIPTFVLFYLQNVWAQNSKSYRIHRYN